MTTTLIVPGLRSSGPDHWQTWLEERVPGSLRVIQSDCDRADLPQWASRVRRDISRTPGRLLIVAHSFGVLAAVQAAADHSARIAGALLVAPADPDKLGVDPDHLPQRPLTFRTVVVASTNDSWMSLSRAAYWADVWQADLVNLGAAGHINSESGFGPWPEGFNLLERLRRGAALAESQETTSKASLAPPAVHILARQTFRGRGLDHATRRALARRVG